MTRVFYPNGGVRQAAVTWTSTDAWNNFTIERITNPNNTVTTTGKDANVSIGTVAYVSGGGLDRNAYLLKGFSAADVEIEATLIPNYNQLTQLGLVLRKQGTIAIIPWTNLVFGFSGQLLHGVWQWSATDNNTLATNQQAETVSYNTPVISSSGDGAIFTVICTTPHGLIAGTDLVDLTSISGTLSNFMAVTTTPDALTFTVASAITGPFTGGTLKRVTAPRPPFLGKYKARLINNILESKSWYSFEGEPSWGSIRAIRSVLPASLASGASLPRGKGGVGFLIAHTGDNMGTAGIADFTVTSLD